MAIIVAFGRSPHAQPLGLEPGTCPACGASGYREVVRRYRVAHVFFVPMFVTGEEVIATCASCGAPERVIAPEGSPPPRWIHRFGGVVAAAIVVPIVLASVAAEVLKAKRGAEQRAAQATLADERLRARLDQVRAPLRLGAVSGLGALGEAIASDAGGVLRERLALRPDQMGLHVVVVVSPTGKRVLLLTELAPGLELASHEPLERIAGELGVVVARHCPPGTLVTWSILAGDDFLASIGGRLGGVDFSERDPARARLRAEATLDYEGFGLAR